MKNLTPVLYLLTILLPAFCSSQNWVWLKCWDNLNLLNVTAPAEAANPAGRDFANNWTHPDGTLWLFGGGGNYENASGSTYYAMLCDLWKYDPATNNWELISERSANSIPIASAKGVPSVNHSPGARRNSVCWTDSAGNFWLYGGEGRDWNYSWGQLNDLWKYNPQTGEWTWLFGSGISGDISVISDLNYGTIGVESPIGDPGMRIRTACWTDDNDNLWLYGGGDYIGMCDLWRYNPATNLWTCMFYDPTGVGVYGTKGVAAPGNHPGARRSGMSFKDPNGNVCLFSGYGYGYNTTAGILNDLWKFDLATHEWTWLSGDSLTSVFGDYSGPDLQPGGRLDNTTGWTDSLGNFWIYGSFGFGSENLGTMTDLWKYDPLTNKWSWMHGGSITGKYGIYGTQGVSAPFNLPGSRKYFSTWATDRGLWLFGGWGFCSTNWGDLNDVYGHLNDLWRFGADEPLKEAVVELPNVFSPNGDGINDLFVPIAVRNAEPLSLIVLNRWGDPVFETEDVAAGWDGTTGEAPCSEGVYFWLIRYRDLLQQEQTQSGFMTLER